MFVVKVSGLLKRVGSWPYPQTAYKVLPGTNTLANYIKSFITLGLRSMLFNRRESKSCSGQVFNFKLGSFYQSQYDFMAYTRPLLEQMRTWKPGTLT